MGKNHRKTNSNRNNTIEKPRLDRYRAFTIKHRNISNRIVTEIKISDAFTPEDPEHIDESKITTITTKALWDTGATNSVITADTARDLGLTPIGKVLVNHADGHSQKNTYTVNIFLPNMVAIIGVLVSECANSDFGAIIGMDIIGRGDFAITNLNDQTWASYRYPSKEAIDFVTLSK